MYVCTMCQLMPYSHGACETNYLPPMLRLEQRNTLVYARFADKRNIYIMIEYVLDLDALIKNGRYITIEKKQQQRNMPQ